ncbi:hypothetical protein FA15DRAFT_659677 [Coprinopsis marcescibilis]|uniref:Uncharacterized protein n=1 Tax=Coprinopsis marcescibilis TaxID=230819 RepID=A0A5C3KIL5_COPMA|nr:hypothetical protein FA15DRAFT_659677 [Coprinopsis marcescibilis]
MATIPTVQANMSKFCEPDNATAVHATTGYRMWRNSQPTKVLQMLDFIKSQQGPVLLPERFKFSWKVQEFPQGTFTGTVRPESLPYMLYGSYKISNETMHQIAKATPGLQSIYFTKEAFYNCSVWRASLPADKRNDVPRAWFLWTSGADQQPVNGEDVNLNGPRNVCFLLKGVPHKSSSQVEDPSHPHYSYLNTKTPQDLDLLARFLHLIKTEGSPSLGCKDFKCGHVIAPHFTYFKEQDKIQARLKLTSQARREV